MPQPVHMIGDKPLRLPLGKDVRSRCGLMGYPDRAVESVYEMVSQQSNTFRATTLKRAVTCRKCTNILTTGSIRAKAKP